MKKFLGVCPEKNVDHRQVDSHLLHYLHIGYSKFSNIQVPIALKYRIKIFVVI